MFWVEVEKRKTVHRLAQKRSYKSLSLGQFPHDGHLKYYEAKSYQGFSILSRKQAVPSMQASIKRRPAPRINSFWMQGLSAGVAY
jgi:hypothetical protein